MAGTAIADASVLRRTDPSKAHARPRCRRAGAGAVAAAFRRSLKLNGATRGAAEAAKRRTN